MHFPRFLLASGLTLLAAIHAVAADTPASALPLLAPAAAPAAPAVPTLVFNGITYTLADVTSTDTFSLNKYVPVGQTLGNWTTMLFVGDWPKAHLPIETVAALLKAAKTYLVAKPQVVGADGEKSTDLAVVLVQSDPKHTSIELDIQRHFVEAGTPGIKWYQYSRHLAPGAPLPTPDEVNALIDSLDKLSATLYLLPPSAGNTTAAASPTSAPQLTDTPATPAK